MYHRFLLLGAATVAGIIGPEADTAGCTAGPEGGAATATDPEDGVVAGAAELAAELFPESTSRFNRFRSARISDATW